MSALEAKARRSVQISWNKTREWCHGYLVVTGRILTHDEKRIGTEQYGTTERRTRKQLGKDYIAWLTTSNASATTASSPDTTRDAPSTGH
jgi:hypothetical protein